MEHEILLGKTGGNAIAYICVFVVMSVGILIAYMLIQSIWYLITGLCMGYTITSYSFAGFMIKYDGKRISCSLAPGRLIAVTTMFKRDITGRTRIILESIVSVLSIISAAIGGAVLVKIYGTTLYVKMACVIIAGMIVFNIIVYISFLKPAFASGEDRKLWEYEIMTRNRYMSGAKPAECETVDIADSNKTVLADRCRLYNYYHYLNHKEYDKLEQYIMRFRAIIGDINNVLASNIPYAYEIIYYYSMIAKDIALAEHYYTLVQTVLVKDMDLNGRRVYAGYLYGTDKPVNMLLETISQGLNDDNLMSNQVAGGLELDLLVELKERVTTERM